MDLQGFTEVERNGEYKYHNNSAILSEFIWLLMQTLANASTVNSECLTKFIPLNRIPMHLLRKHLGLHRFTRQPIVFPQRNRGRLGAADLGEKISARISTM
jgi:hypothetical protein